MSVWNMAVRSIRFQMSQAWCRVFRMDRSDDAPYEADMLRVLLGRPEMTAEEIVASLRETDWYKNGGLLQVGKVMIRRRSLDILLDIIEDRTEESDLSPAERGAIKQAYEALERGDVERLEVALHRVTSAPGDDVLP